MMDQDQAQERIHGLEVAQSTQAATMAGTEATQAAAQAGTWSTMIGSSAGFILGIFLGMAVAATRK